MKKIIYLTVVLCMCAFFNGYSQCSTFRGMYVDKFDQILSDAGKKTCLLNYAQANGYNYFALYGISNLSKDASSHFNNSGEITNLNNFITSAHAIGISIGAVGESPTTLITTIPYYNNSQVGGVATRKFDVLNWEFEFWNAEVSGNPLCASYYTCSGSYGACNVNTLFKCMYPSMVNIHNAAAATNGSNGLPMKFEIYLGWPNATQMDTIVTQVDRILLHTYRKDDSDIYSYDCGRMIDIMNAGIAHNKVVDVAPMFSNEPSFMGPWLLGNSIPIDQPFESFLYDYRNSATCSFPVGGKAKVNLVGYHWFTYSDMQATISVPNDGSVYFCEGGGANSITFTGYTAGTGYTYQWNKNGVAIGGANSNTYNYSVPTNSSGSTVTTDFTLTYTPPGACALTTPKVSITVYSTHASQPTITQANGSACYRKNLTSSASTYYKWKPSDLTTQTLTDVNIAERNTVTIWTSAGGTYLGCASLVPSVSPDKPKINSNGATTLCSGGTANLSAYPASGVTWAWSNGVTTQTNSVSPSSTTPYTVTVTAGGCSRSSSSRRVIINAVSAPSVSNQTIFTCQSATLSGTPGTNGTTLNWYSASSGGSPLTTGLSYTTPNLSTTTTYYVTSLDCYTGCESSPRTSVTVTVNNEPGSLGFDGSDDRSRVPHISNYDLGTGDFTVEAKIEFDGTSTKSYPMIFSRRIVNNGGILFGIWNTTPGSYTGKLFAQLGGATPNQVDDTGTLLTGDCYHVALKRSGSTCTMFVNGVAEKTFTNTNSLTTSSATDLYMGYDSPNGSNAVFKGNMHEVRFWNIARSDADIAAFQDCALNGNETGLIGYWPLQEGSGQNIVDHSSIVNSGFLGTNNTVESTDPSWTSNCGHRVLSSFGNQIGNGQIPDSLLVKQPGFILYPNPSSDQITLESLNNPGTIIIYLYDGQGRIVKTITSDQKQTLIGIKEIPAGMYAVKVTSERGFLSEFKKIQIVK